MRAKEFIDEAKKILKDRKTEYENIINLVMSYLETLLSEIRGITISGRTKDADNIADELFLGRN